VSGSTLVTMDDLTEEVAQLIAQLKPVDIRTMGLLALGWSNGGIAERLEINVSAVDARIKTILKKIRIDGQIGMVLFYAKYVLPTDTISGYAEPGEKLLAWRAQAERRRQELVREGVLTPRVVQAVELFVNPAYADKDDATLGAAMPGTRLTAGTYASYLEKVTTVLTPSRRVSLRRARHRLAAIATLAPFGQAG
jgi:DNA-binding CsgD family transcriptional regulator